MAFYGEGHRALQDEFDSRRLADRLEEIIVLERLDERSRDFIAAREFFYLGTLDHEGFPSVSFKGGEVGFVHIADDQTLQFPCYDGNGMFFSMGNIETHAQVGLLFQDFEEPGRLRAKGRATLTRDPSVVEQWHECNLAVEVKLEQIWVNCPRYIPRYQRIEGSEFVPSKDCETPVPEWKAMPLFEDVLPKT